MISGTCYYFEARKYDQSDAQENCRNKFGLASKGGLFEPQSSTINEDVHAEAIKVSGMSS